MEGQIGLLGDAQAAQLLLSCSGTAFAASTGLSPRFSQQPLTPGNAEELRPSQTSPMKQLTFQLPADSKEQLGLPISTAAASPTSTSIGRKFASRQSGSTAVKRPYKPAPVQQHLHPVLHLGYEPLCEVHCNGLQGVFLGGHDRDLYIQCTSHEYADLPLVDVSQGGCVMSCSHFERAAGRELSKKWKESIHVVGEGEGSKATLLAWLKRQADAMSPDLIGSPVWVCWCNEADFYQGTIVSVNKESGKHKVRYNERFVEELHLPVEKLDFGQAKPQVSVAEPSSGQPWTPVPRPVLQQTPPHSLPSVLTSKPVQGYGDSAALGMAAETAPSPVGQSQALPHHLWHQSSGTSMTSTSTDHNTGLRHINTRKRSSTVVAASPRAASSLQQPVTPSRSRRSGRSGSALACTETLQESGDGVSGLSHTTHMAEFDDSTITAVPKKPRTGLREAHPLRHAISMPGTGRTAEQQSASPLAGLASLATATSLALGSGHFDDHQHQQQQQQQQAQPPQHQHSGMSTSRAFAAPLLGSLSSVQQMAILCVPPAAGLQEADITVMCHWMNKVALQLDDVLVDGVHMLAEPVTVGPGSGAGQLQQPLRQHLHHGSPSARFQNLLIYARGRGTVQGYYEAMLTRYEHFRDKPAALLVKMAEFITAALSEESNKQFHDAVVEQHRLNEA